MRGRERALVLATGLGKTLVFSELAAHRGHTACAAPSARRETLGLRVGVEQVQRRSGDEPVVAATAADDAASCSRG